MAIAKEEFNSILFYFVPNPKRAILTMISLA